jgi:hypothetical protein
MIPFPALRRFWQRPPLRFALLGLLLAGGAAWYVAMRGGWANILALPPLLDASTPRTQNGFTLLDVQRPGRIQDRNGHVFAGFISKNIEYQAVYGSDAIDTADAFGLWIKPPSFPDNRSSGNVDSESSYFSKSLSGTARLSTGETIPLGWHLRDDEWQPPGQAPQRLLFVALPSGYSDASRFVDFTVADQSGHAAHWRIARLPQMCYTVPPPATLTSTITQDGITMSAQAWHDQPSQINGTVSYIFRPLLPPNSHQWDVVTTGLWHEWEPYNYDGHIKVYETSGQPILGRNGVFSTEFERWYGGGIHDLAGTDPYPDTNHFLRLTCELRQFETYDEPVTFHNIPVRVSSDYSNNSSHNPYLFFVKQPLTLTTPSGIAVTLPVQGGYSPMATYDAISFQLSARRSATPSDLPKSPLMRQFDKPVTISLHVAAPDTSSGQTLNPGEMQTYMLRHSLNPAWHVTPKGTPPVPFYLDVPPILKDLTVIVRQRINIRTIPMAFTLPIADHTPTYYPKGYQPPKRL